jgi:hypothetical protein
MKSSRSLLYSLIFAVPLVVIFSQCLNSYKSKPDPRADIFAGAATCVKCHKDIYDSYVHTAHFLSTRPAGLKTISGGFDHDNTFYFNKELRVVMNERGDRFYQTAFFKNKKVADEPFDITFGGVKAETYLYWKGDKVYQLPISYFKALHNWTNSPGFDTTKVNFNRLIGRRCFECHSSYIIEKNVEQQGLNHEVQLDKSSLIYGIDCERCHGPAANHVNYHTEFPEVKKPMYIKTFTSLTRTQRIDVCATCHSGNVEKTLRSIFTFKPGDNLAQFKEVAFVHRKVDSTRLDVHGNQTQMLESSKCFISSKMECITCHDVHKPANIGGMAAYSAKCLSCHDAASHNECKLTGSLGIAIKNNCIDCHMPNRPSSVIAVQTSGKGEAVPYLVRSHHIAVYKDQATLVKSDLKKYNLSN